MPNHLTYNEIWLTIHSKEYAGAVLAFFEYGKRGMGDASCESQKKKQRNGD